MSHAAFPDLPFSEIAPSIIILRGHRVLLDSDLAGLYGLTIGRFSGQVRRHLDRFPKDFMFQLTEQEFELLKSQLTSSDAARFSRRRLPYAFTEHGTIMAASILNSPRASEVPVYIVRAFIQLRNLVASNQDIFLKVTELAQKVSSHDQAIAGLINALSDLMHPEDPPKKRPIGFIIPEDTPAKARNSK